jgi:aspartate 1-decarboxylase
MNSQKVLYMPGEMTIAELVHAIVTGAALGYVGSVTVYRKILEAAGILPGEMVYIDNVDRKGPPWRTYTVPGNVGEIIMNGPPAYHFAIGDSVTIRAAALMSYEDMPRMAEGHTEVYFEQPEIRNHIGKIKRVPIPDAHWRKMCISKLHRIRVNEVSKKGPEALIVDADILDQAGFPAGIEAQFTSLRDGAIRRTSVQAGPRGTGMAKVQGSGAWHIEPGTLLVSLAEAWLPYNDAVKNTEPRVVFFDESITDRNVIISEKTKLGWRPSRPSF